MYKLTNTTNIIRTCDGAFIPADENNFDYQAYLLWIAQGNTPCPSDINEPIECKTSIQKLVDVLVTKGVLNDDDKTEIQPTGEP